MENIKALLEEILTEVFKNSEKKVDDEGYTYVQVKKDEFLKLFEESDLEKLLLGDMEGFEIHDMGELVTDMLEEFELAECIAATLDNSDNSAYATYLIYPYELLSHLL